VNEDLAEMRRLADSFAATIREQGRQVETGMRSMSSALDQAANRLAAVMGGAAVTAAPAAAAAGGAAIAPGGIVQVRVVNDRLPVFVVNAPPPPDRGGAGGILGAIGSGIGGLIGGIVGGFVGGAASPFLLFGDIVALMAGMPGILDRVLSILREARQLTTELVRGIRGLIVLLFSELTAAGIFPVSRLIASLLFLIDRGITLVLMHVQPIILWVERVIETITTWLGQYIERIASFITNLVNALATFLAACQTFVLQQRSEKYVHDIFESLRPVSVASRANKPIGDRMIMNAAFLVRRDKEQDFDAIVKRIGTTLDKLTFKYTGPWPPYNFVNIRLKLERA